MQKAGEMEAEAMRARQQAASLAVSAKQLQAAGERLCTSLAPHLTEPVQPPQGKPQGQQGPGPPQQLDLSHGPVSGATDKPSKS